MNINQIKNKYKTLDLKMLIVYIKQAYFKFIAKY